MKRKYFLVTGIILFCSWAMQAQTKKKVVKKQSPAKQLTVSNIEQTNVQLGELLVKVKGKLFNEILYNTDQVGLKNKYVAYYYWDEAKKNLVITEVYYEVNKEKAEAQYIDVYTLPKDKINKKESYNLDMDDDFLDQKNYQRLTLLSTGINEQSFTKEHQSIGTDAPITSKLTNVTINIVNKTQAANYLKEFIKL